MNYTFSVCVVYFSYGTFRGAANSYMFRNVILVIYCFPILNRLVQVQRFTRCYICRNLYINYGKCVLFRECRFKITFIE